MRFHQFPGKEWNKEILPGAKDTAVNVVKRLICYEPTQRMTAEEVRLPGPHWRAVRIDALTTLQALKHVDDMGW